MEQNKKTTENTQNEKGFQSFSLSEYVNADSVIYVAEDMSGQFLEGDIVFIRKQNKFNPGDLVAIDVEDGGLVCRRYSDGDIIIYTREDGGAPILIDLDEQKDVKILGLVVGVYQPLDK